MEKVRYMVWRNIEGYRDYYLWDTQTLRTYCFEYQDSESLFGRDFKCETVAEFCDCDLIESFSNDKQLEICRPEWFGRIKFEED
jgi:hypothetical protein